MVRGINKVQLTGWLGIGGRKALASVEVAGTHRTYRRQRARAWFGVWSLGVLQLQADTRSLFALLDLYSRLFAGLGNNTLPIVSHRW
jgi:hypothetical protein